MTDPAPAVALLVTGASGMRLAVQLVRALASHPDVARVHLVASRGASQVLAHELGRRQTGAVDLVAAAQLPADAAARVEIHPDSALDAAIASGSYRLAGTVVAPCSGGTLGALATGSAATLVHRAGAVALKERWPLVLGFRETPLSIVHLENLRRLAYAGALVLPPVPAFYVGGDDLGRFLDAWTARVLDHLGLATTARADALRWPAVDAD